MNSYKEHRATNIINGQILEVINTFKYLEFTITCNVVKAKRSKLYLSCLNYLNKTQSYIERQYQFS